MSFLEIHFLVTFWLHFDNFITVYKGHTNFLCQSYTNDTYFFGLDETNFGREINNLELALGLSKYREM